MLQGPFGVPFAGPLPTGAQLSMWHIPSLHMVDGLGQSSSWLQVNSQTAPMLLAGSSTHLRGSGQAAGFERQSANSQ
jgi:hypothetical protein